MRNVAGLTTEDDFLGTLANLGPPYFIASREKAIVRSVFAVGRQTFEIVREVPREEVISVYGPRAEAKGYEIGKVGNDRYHYEIAIR